MNPTWKFVSPFLLATLLSPAGCYVGPASGGPPPPPPPPQQQTEVVESPPPPPPPQPDPPPPPAPGPDYEWIGGYQRWNGHGYGWEKGHYEHRPHSGARWQQAHWEQHGRQHVWVEGRWD
jgi:hypothetical protein